LRSSPDKGRKYVAPKPKIRKKAPGEEEAENPVANFTEFIDPKERYAKHTECSKLHFEATKEYIEDILATGKHPTMLL
jgi:hypothetical protein